LNEAETSGSHVAHHYAPILIPCFHSTFSVLKTELFEQALIVHLCSSLVMLVVSIVVVVIGMNSKEQGPFAMLFVVFIITILVHLVISFCIIWDLDRRDHITIEGKLIEKQQLYNGWKFRVRGAGEERLRTFRMNTQFDETFMKLEIDDPITVTYFRLTRAVFAIHRPSVVIESIKE
jgi:hypothetical protein